MRAKLLAIAICIVCLWGIVYGANPVDYEIITMFGEKVVVMPQGMISASISDVGFCPEAIKETLLNHHAHTISMAFPDYDPADSLIESPRFPGLFAKQPALDRIFRIVVDDPDIRDALNVELKTYHEVYFSDKNGGGETYLVPNDPYFPLQWGMNNQTNPLADINAPESWDLTPGNPLAVIGIIDVGVDASHVEFQGRISGEGPAVPIDHATHVAGIAAAAGNNGVGVAGFTWNSHIYSKNISGFDIVDIYNSIIDAISHGDADVLNCSWGFHDYISLMHVAFGIAHDLGVIGIASRGNDYGNTPNYPANYNDCVLSVGSIKKNGFRSSFSSYGSGLDLVAPGGAASGAQEQDIYSTSLNI